MGIRELLEKQKRLVIPAVVVGIAACAYSAWRTHKAEEIPGMIERAYYSDDDGKTYFADDVKQGFSFDHGGNTAYRAFVYRCNSGKPFVGLLARTTEPSGPKPADPNPVGKRQAGPPPPMEVRKPGTTKWVSTLSPEYQPLLQSVCRGENPDALLP